MKKVNFTLGDIMEDLERSQKEWDRWTGQAETAPKPPVVHIGDMCKNWEPIATSDGYTIYGARYSSGYTHSGRGVVSLLGDYDRLQDPQRDIMRNHFPEGSIVVKMNCSSDPSHGTIYWAEKEGAQKK